MFDLIFMMKDIYIKTSPGVFKKFRSSSKSIKFTNMLSWNISEMILKHIFLNLMERQRKLRQ